MIGKMSKEFFEAVKMLEAEKGIPADYLYEKIAAAIVVYVAVILLIKGMTKEYILMIPKGEKIANILEKKNLI